jgi:hypothetical protein
MFHQLVSHNDDLLWLMEKGFAFSVDGGYLVVRDVPYLDSQRQLQWGAFVAKLVFVDNLTVKQDNHQMWFAGSVPYALMEIQFLTSAVGRRPWRLVKPARMSLFSANSQTSPNLPASSSISFTKLIAT